MESKNEKHLDMDQLIKLVRTARFLLASGRREEQVVADLMQSHGLTVNDVQTLFKLISHA